MDSFLARLPAVSSQVVIRWLTATFALALISVIKNLSSPALFCCSPPPTITQSIEISEVVGSVHGNLIGLVAAGATIALTLTRRRGRGQLATLQPFVETRIGGGERESSGLVDLEAQAGISGRRLAPRDIWKPTDLELDMVSTQMQNPALSVPPSVGEPVENGLNELLVHDAPYHGIEKEHADQVLPDILSKSLAIQPPDDGPQTFMEFGQAKPDLHNARSNPAPTEEESATQLPHPQFSCPVFNCIKTFAKKYELNHHMRYHEKSKKCETCDKSFGTITHLERHVNSAHLSTKGFYCTAAGCKYSKTVPSPEFFSRKDNWRRHMRDKHGWS